MIKIVKIEGKIIELSERFDDIKMYDFHLVVVEVKDRPKLDFSKPIFLSQDEE